MRLGAMLTAAVVGWGVVLGAQSPEIRPTWKDLETWSRYNATPNETEIGLGLQPSGPTGSLALAFTAALPGKSPRPPAKEILVLVAMSPNFNSTVIRDVKLIFVLDEGQPKLNVMDLSPRFLGNELIPTTNLRSGIARMTPDEYQRLTRARAIKANVLGAEVAFSKAQLDAMRAYGKKVVPAPAR